MNISIDGLRFNMARNILDFVDELRSHCVDADIQLPEIVNEKLDQCLRDVRFLGCIDFRKDETVKDGGFIFKELDKLFVSYVEDN